MTIGEYEETYGGPFEFPVTRVKVDGRWTSEEDVERMKNTPIGPLIPASDPPETLTVPEVAKLLRVGRNKVYEAVQRNEIPHARIGRLIRFSRAEIMRWLAGDACKSR